ncbi:hypothetical protein PO909_010872 [Leuciscus waleckii]
MQSSVRFLFSPPPPPPPLFGSLSVPFCRSEVQGRLSIPQITLQRACKSLHCWTEKDSKIEENLCPSKRLSSCQILP